MAISVQKSPKTRVWNKIKNLNVAFLTFYLFPGQGNKPPPLSACLANLQKNDIKPEAVWGCCGLNLWICSRYFCHSLVNLRPQHLYTFENPFLPIWYHEGNYDMVSYYFIQNGLVPKIWSIKIKQCTALSFCTILFTLIFGETELEN